LEINIPIEELRKRKLFVGVPMFGGQCSGMYAKSSADLAAICAQYQIPLQYYYLFNESLIPRARNYVCDEFMRSGASHLMFIDADIGFNPQDVIALMALQAQDTKYDVIGGPYPKKCISWEKIKLACDKGVADENPGILEKFVGDYVFNPKGGQNQILISEPCEVLEIGTGFMMITREAMQKFADSYPEYMYKPDHARTEHFDGSRKIMQFFQSEIDPVSERYLSEDYWFCQKAQAVDIKTWLCPWIKLQHVGSYVFGGSLADLGSIGASATVNPEDLKKQTKRLAPIKSTNKKSNKSKK
jgi:hypothetical protein